MKFLHHIYTVIYRWYTLHLIHMATKATHKLMVMIGKDPNAPKPLPQPYVPPKYDDMDINRAWMVDTRERPAKWRWATSSDSDYVKNPADHPIIRSRVVYQQKLAKQAIEQAAKEAAAKAAEVAQQALQVTEIGSEAVNSLREAVSGVERAVIESEKKAD